MLAIDSFSTFLQHLCCVANAVMVVVIVTVSVIPSYNIGNGDYKSQQL